MSSGKVITLSLRSGATVAEVEFVVLGYIVKASIEGGKGMQPISQRFTSKAAAEAYKDLAIKQGFADAFVSEVTGLEANKKEPRASRRMELQPPQRKK